MGCDIHLGVEIRDASTGKWSTWLNGQTPCSHCGGHHYNYDEGADEEECKHCTEPFLYGAGIFDRGRHYLLFAILAGARNYWEVVPIAGAKGLPADMSSQTKLFLMDPGDGHTDSWLTVTEMQAYDLSQTTESLKYIPLASYDAWSDRTQLPSGTRDYLHKGEVKEAAYKEFIASLPLDTDGLAPCEAAARAAARFGMKETPTHVAVDFPVAHRDNASYFFGEFLPKIAKLGAPEDVRIVFNFDN